ncbi:ABC transporter [Enterobacter roggenkampii]|nr:ABC transporter [Enterobacter roggenkampii]
MFTGSVELTRTLIKSAREGANKQVISSQADSLIKISRIWADFFPANTSNQPI